MSLSLAEFYEKGSETIPRNYEKAAQEYERLISYNPSLKDVALYRIGMLYTKGDGHLKKDYDKACEYLEKSKTPEASCQLGQLYEEGLGPRSSLSVAKQWYFRAINMGSVDALKKMGMVLYKEGKKGDKSWKRAFDHFASYYNEVRNDKEVLNHMGLICKGFGDVGTNYALAFRYWSEGAELGDARCKFHLGKLYESGHGVQQDKTKACLLFREAAAIDTTLGDYVLGWMYMRGTSGEKSLLTSKIYFEAAAKNKIADSEDLLKEVNRLLGYSPSQQQEQQTHASSNAFAPLSPLPPPEPFVPFWDKPAEDMTSTRAEPAPSITLEANNSKEPHYSNIQNDTIRPHPLSVPNTSTAPVLVSETMQLTRHGFDIGVLNFLTRSNKEAIIENRKVISENRQVIDEHHRAISELIAMVEYDTNAINANNELIEEEFDDVEERIEALELMVLPPLANTTCSENNLYNKVASLEKRCEALEEESKEKDKRIELLMSEMQLQNKQIQALLKLYARDKK